VFDLTGKSTYVGTTPQSKFVRIVDSTIDVAPLEEIDLRGVEVGGLQFGRRRLSLRAARAGLRRGAVGTGNAAHLRSNVASLLKPPLPEADRAKLATLFGDLTEIGLDGHQSPSRSTLV
jgi:hypothetical protein